MWIFNLMSANQNWELLRNVPTTKKKKKKGGISADKASVCKYFRAEIFSKIVNKLLKQMN